MKNPPDGAAAAGISVALARLKRGELLSPTSTAWLIRTMDGAKTGRYRVHGAVPAGWVYGHKTGTGMHGTANDIAILWPKGGGKPLLVAAYLTEAKVGSALADSILASVGRAVAAARLS